MAEYVFDNAAEAAGGRFGALEELYDPVTIRVLTAAGLREGWRCLEVGGGSGSIARWMGERVGPSGRVVVTDINTRFLEQLALPNVEVRQHDIVNDPLEESAFDLAHTRLVLVHIPERVAAIERMVRALKPGGLLVLQEFDSLSMYPDPTTFPGEHLLKTMAAMHRVMTERGVNLRFGRELPAVLTGMGLPDVEAEGHVVWFKGGSAGGRLFEANFLQMREAILASGGVTAEEFDEDLAQLQNPSVMWPSSVLWTVTARRP
jgi:SAM-dependent methyltransferase